MKYSKRFLRAYKRLKTAYWKGDIDYGSCRKCAIGKICSDVDVNWHFALEAYRNGRPLHDQFLIDLNRLKTSSGYSLEEIDKIEDSFERSKYIFISWKHSDQDNLKEGLKRVLELLCQFDKVKVHPNFVIKRFFNESI